MAFRVNQKIGKHVYVYEVKAYWDKNKKQARQRREYIGKLDKKTGKVIMPVSTKPKASLDYGDIYFVEQLFANCGLKEILYRHYEELGPQLFQLCAYQVIDGSAMCLCEDWASSTEQFKSSKLSSQNISKLLSRVGDDEATRQLFFADWINFNHQSDGVFFDITSFSSYSKQCNMVEWGYNRDDEELPQINFGLVLSYPKSVPLFYRIYPGSITDVKTIKNIGTCLDSYKIKNVTLVLDRGFYSQQNLLNIYDTFNDFIIPIPFSTKLSEDLLSDAGSFSFSKNLKVVGNKHIFCTTKTIPVFSKTVNAHIYFDEFRRASQLATLVSRFETMESNYLGKRFENESSAQTYLDQEFQIYKKYYSITKNQAGNYILERNSASIDEALAKMGKMILLTKQSIDAQATLALYRSKDAIEKCFDSIKNDLSGKRLHAHTDPTVIGRLFISFLAVVLHASIMKTIKENKTLKHYSVQQLLRELKKIKMIELQSKKQFLTEISKKQRDIFTAFSIKMPEMAHA